MATQRKNWLEWLVLTAGAVLVLACAGVLVYQMARSDGQPPQIGVSLGAPERRGDRFALPVTVWNTGDITAEDLWVEVSLDGGGDSERGTVHLNYLTGRGTGHGWVMFARRPSPADLHWRVLGFKEP